MTTQFLTAHMNQAQQHFQWNKPSNNYLVEYKHTTYPSKEKKRFKLILSPNVSSYYIPKFISSIWFCELIYVNFDNIVYFSRILTIREYTFFSEILPFDICLCLSHEFLFSLCIFTNLLGVIKVLNFTLSMSSSDLWRELSQSDSAIVPYQL